MKIKCINFLNFSFLAIFSMGLFMVALHASAQTVDCGSNFTYKNGVCLPNNTSGSGLTSANDLPSLISTVIKILLYFAGMVDVVMILVGGYRYISSAGNEEQAEKGKNALINALIGLVVIVLAYVIVNVVANTLISPLK